VHSVRSTDQMIHMATHVLYRVDNTFCTLLVDLLGQELNHWAASKSKDSLRRIEALATSHAP